MKALLLVLLPTLLVASDQSSIRGTDLEKPNELDAIPDHKISAEFLKKAEELQDAGALTSMSVLREQLSRRTTSLSLSRTRKEKTLLPHEIHSRAKKAVVSVGSIYKCTRCTRWH